MRFQNQGELRMAGTDGTFIYTAGPCGLQRVDPETGGTTSVLLWYNHTSVAGRYLYGVNSYNQLFQHDLQDFTSPRYLGQVNAATPIAADADNVWYTQGSLLHRFDIATGTNVTVTTTTGLPGSVYRMQSIGGYLYASISSGRLHQLIRIAKATGNHSRSTAATKAKPASTSPKSPASPPTDRSSTSSTASRRPLP